METTKQIKRNRITNDNERFLSSMTFTSFGKSCDCDECGISCLIPSDVAFAIDEHKRQKMIEDNLITVLQERNLIMREGGVSIWKLVMPPGCEPLIEYGNSHRIIVVEYMPENRIVKSIGKGIIGSSSEEKSRVKSEWNENGGYLHRSNGGKAIGWLNEKLDVDKTINVSDTTNDVVLYIIKVTADAMTEWTTNRNNEGQNDADSTPSWVNTVVKIFQKYLNIKEIDEDTTTSAEIKTDSKMQHTELKLSSEDVSTLQKLINEFMIEASDSK